MTVQNEVEWLLDTIRAEWPGGNPPDTVALRNRDEPETRYPDPTWAEGVKTVREKAVSTDRWTVVGVSSGSVQREPYGTRPQYRVQTTLDVRVESKTGDSWGESDDVSDFDTVVAYTQEAISKKITYPEVDPNAESIGFVVYLDSVIQDQQNLSSGDKDYYRTDFTVLLRGNQQTPEQT